MPSAAASPASSSRRSGSRRYSSPRLQSEPRPCRSRSRLRLLDKQRRLLLCHSPKKKLCNARVATASLDNQTEEGGVGAKKMTDEGTVQSVNAIFGLHVDSKLRIGEVASRSGPLLAGSGMFEAVIGGKGAHATIPQHSIDPILAAFNVVVSLQHLVSREADPLDSQVCTF
ncbi:unnamed protein product [Linum tenue]|uniref:Peptidase M20 dimerisation domain-containing protein n=1 Tax=Linum tenue TaxID=586396 RepID=A0AAV0NUP8_9ROSI|nr:unnamed protein product [Linum tenue]